MRRFVVSGLVVLTMMLDSSQAAKKMDRLIVYGEGFAFGVKEPEGWTGDIESATDFAANIVFYRSKKALKGNGPLIRVRVNDKADEDTSKDLQADMDGYKKEHPGVLFEDLQVSHPQYKCLSRAFILEKQFHEYVAYVNPGEGIPLLLSVSLSMGKDPATPEDLEAYRQVISSLVMLKKKSG